MSCEIYNLLDKADRNTFAVIYNGKTYSYDDFCSQIAILEKNIKKLCDDWRDKRVYLDIEDRFLLFVTFFTFMKLDARCVLIPIEIKPADYVNEHDFFISDNKLIDNGAKLNADLSLTAGEKFDAAKVSARPGQPAVYLYTSGSTGKSKLIPNSSSNLLTEVKALAPMMGVQSAYKFYFTPPIYHIYGLLFDLLLPVYCSCTICLDAMFSPQSVADYVAENQIDFFVSTPTYYRMIADLGLVSSFSKCKKLTSSSAPLDADVSKSFLDGGLQIIEIYGSTETGGIAHRVGAVSQDWTLFPYVSVCNKAKADEITEFLIDSATISVEYGADGYNTNDLVKFKDNDNSKFQLVGRNTRFVKIAGKRLDLSFVFSKLTEYLGSCGLKANTDNMFVGMTADEKIYILYNGDFPKSHQEMKEDLKKVLPGYGIPRYYIKSAVPRNSMSKIDKVKIDEIVKNYISTL